MRNYTLQDLEDYLPVYTDVVRNGFKSKFLGDASECLMVLEYFEEYEKCKDILPYVNNKRNKPTSNMDEIEQS